MSNKLNFRKIFLTASIISAVLLFFALFIYILIVAPMYTLYFFLGLFAGAVVITVFYSLIPNIWSVL